MNANRVRLPKNAGWASVAIPGETPVSTCDGLGIPAIFQGETKLR